MPSLYLMKQLLGLYPEETNDENGCCRDEEHYSRVTQYISPTPLGYWPQNTSRDLHDLTHSVTFTAFPGESTLCKVIAVSFTEFTVHLLIY
ncbi:hypothetical protein J6590_044200 [Homalodisca vitripennis]|nr:hypothetical protein J6590_044200 [Homalodisca vitripennis]